MLPPPLVTRDQSMTRSWGISRPPDFFWLQLVAGFLPGHDAAVVTAAGFQETTSFLQTLLK